MTLRQNNDGFTLIELMIAVGIIAGLAAIAIPSYRQYVMTSRIAECANEVAAIRLGEEEFFLLNNRYVAGTLNGPGDLSLSTNLGPNYTPSNKAAGLDVNPPNCTYAVVVPCAGPPPPPGAAQQCYDVTATGINDLAGMGVVATFTGP